MADGQTRTISASDHPPTAHHHPIWPVIRPSLPDPLRPYRLYSPFHHPRSIKNRQNLTNCTNAHHTPSPTEHNSSPAQNIEHGHQVPCHRHQSSALTGFPPSCKRLHGSVKDRLSLDSPCG